MTDTRRRRFQVMNIKINNQNELDPAAEQFAKAIGDRRHFAFHAPMGAGKTTFISAICRILGSDDEASSPTFSIVNEYGLNSDSPAKSMNPPFGRIFHFDFYRVETPEEFLDMGLDDYWDSGALCLIEWPENAGGFLPDDIIDISIEVLPDDSRLISCDIQ